VFSAARAALVATQGYGKHIPTEANARNNTCAVFTAARGALVATQGYGKHIVTNLANGKRE
jgi:hypothetical protein